MAPALAHTQSCEDVCEKEMPTRLCSTDSNQCPCHGKEVLGVLFPKGHSSIQQLTQEDPTVAVETLGKGQLNFWPQGLDLRDYSAWVQLQGRDHVIHSFLQGRRACESECVCVWRGGAYAHRSIFFSSSLLGVSEDLSYTASHLPCSD